VEEQRSASKEEGREGEEAWSFLFLLPPLDHGVPARPDGTHRAVRSSDHSARA
jgi:hypothetical protein